MKMRKVRFFRPEFNVESNHPLIARMIVLIHPKTWLFIKRINLMVGKRSIKSFWLLAIPRIKYIRS